MPDVRIRVSAHEDTPPEELKSYVACVQFLAYWLEKQDGLQGKTTEELFDEFKDHVCKRMVGTTGGMA